MARAQVGSEVKEPYGKRHMDGRTGAVAWCGQVCRARGVQRARACVREAQALGKRSVGMVARVRRGMVSVPVYR